MTTMKMRIATVMEMMMIVAAAAAAKTQQSTMMAMTTETTKATTTTIAQWMATMIPERKGRQGRRPRHNYDNIDSF